MEEFKLHIIGCGSANPMKKYHPACQILSMRGKLFMVDCGEGSQMRLAGRGLHINRIGHIFISHTHGDHCFGLPGLISTMGLLGRVSQLHIHAPEELRSFIDIILTDFCQEMDYEVIFHPVDTKAHQLVYEDKSIEVYSLPLRHRVPCCGYLFREKPLQPHIRREMIDAFDIPFSQIANIKAGMDWTTPDGTVIPNHRLTIPADPPRSYAYLSDTAYKPSLAELIHGIDLLFHEATFDAASALRARQTYHSTTTQAATVALKAEAKRLVIGHFSARIKDEQAYLREAQEVFPNTLLAHEAMAIDI